MARNASRSDLKQYCLRQLGFPVIEINVDDDQVEDRIDDAFDMFYEYHFNATERSFISIQLTAQDIANKYLTVGPEVLVINRLLPFDSALNSINLQYQAFFQDMLDSRNFKGNNINGYVITQQYLTTIQELFNWERTIRFNRYESKVYIEMDWSLLSVGDFVVIEGWIAIDPDVYTGIYNDMWLKKYTTALIKKQWGQNLIKYDGVQLPGGIVLNGRQLFDDANNEIQILEQTLQTNYQLPIDFMVG